jgi:hypothetical protein
MTQRPPGSNAEEWRLFLWKCLDNRATSPHGLTFVAVQIAEAIEAERERCAQLHESVNPASDDERLHNVPGAGAMGAVLEYRDLIRTQR